MNDMYLRMKSLLEDAGIAFNSGGISKAEIYAYSKGVELVLDSISDGIDDIFMQGSSNLKRYALLLNIDSERYSPNALKTEIKNRLAMNFAEATVDEHERAFSAVGSGTYTLYHEDGELLPTIKFADVDIEDLPQLAKFIEGYTCLSERATYDGSGMDFDAWDAWGQSFYQLDKMALPFNIIDNLRSDMIE